MIYVTLGTQDKSFARLLEAIQKEIDNGTIKDEVIVQAGHTSFESKKMKIFDLVSLDKFNEYMDECDLLITHAGVGSIVDGLKRGKTVIAVPRLKEYSEHTNNHQLQIAENFGNKGYIIPVFDTNELHDALLKSKKFKPNKYVSNSANFVKLVQEYIDK